MLKRINFLYDFASIFYETCFASIIFMVGRELIARKPFHLIFIGAVFVSFLFSHIIREKSETVMQSIWIHVGMLIVSILLPIDSYYNQALVFLDLYLMIASAVFVKNNKVINVNSNNTLPVFGGLVLMYIIGYAQKSAYVMKISYIGAVILLVTYLIISYLNGIISYMSTYDDISNVPVKRMVKSSSIIATLVVFIAFVFMFFSGNDALNYAINKIADLLIWAGVGIGSLLVKLIRLFEKIKNDEPILEDDKMEMPDMSEDVSKFPYEILFAIVGIIVISFVFVNLIRLLFSSKGDDGDLIEDAVLDTEETIQLKHKKFRKMSMEEKARYYYRQKVLKHKGDITLSRSTTSENIKCELKENSDKDMSEITKLYTDIRYGGKSVDKAVLKQMNNLKKQ